MLFHRILLKIYGEYVKDLFLQLPNKELSLSILSFDIKLNVLINRLFLSTSKQGSKQLSDKSSIRRLHNDNDALGDNVGACLWHTLLFTLAHRYILKEKQVVHWLIKVTVGNITDFHSKVTLSDMMPSFSLQIP